MNWEEKYNAIAELVDGYRRERDEAREKAETYERDWYATKADFGTAMGKMREALRAAEKRELEALAELDEARAEVEKLSESAKAAWEAECVMREQRDRYHAEWKQERQEVERLRAEADRWKRSCNVFREQDWPKAFQATVTSLEQEVSDAHEQLAKLRKLSKPWEGTAYRRGAEAMREACARWISEREGISQWVYDDALSALPIPEDK